MPKLDNDFFDRAQKLLDIVEKVSRVAPGYTHITSEAMAELREMDQFIRRQKESDQGLIPAPAPVGDPDSPPPQTGATEPTNPALDPEPTASTSIERRV